MFVLHRFWDTLAKDKTNQMPSAMRIKNLENLTSVGCFL